ncbi:AAA family ATPase [bacterium]|nr:AAA family ATPase [bacterium]
MSQGELEFHAIDYLFARHLLKKEDHPLFPFCKELMKASREGHLFLTKKELPEEISELLARKDSPIIQDGEHYYLRKNFLHEKELANFLSSRILTKGEELAIPCPEGLNAMQQKAFSLLNTTSFFLITGGPGSGKSFVAKEIIKAYKNAYPEKKIICTAPTGKALSALSKAHEDSITMHKLLGIKEGFVQKEKRPTIIADLLIVDECSMISPALFHALFSALLDHTKVILIGDPHQLPPVSGASIFHDFTNIHALPKVKLLSPMRSDKEAIITFADAILEEDMTKIESLLEEENEITLSPLESYTPIQKKDHILLTPFRKGPYGSLKLNEQIAIKKGEQTPILITRNDSITGLSNGDIGYLEEEVALFPEKNLSIPKLMLPPYEKAFALSIHKSQGSEFDHISILIPENAAIFPKELFFTAITRAKKSIHIYGEIGILKTLIQNRSSTSSRLSQKVDNQMSIGK